MKFSDKDLNRLRTLAGQQAELAASDRMARLWQDWKRHGAQAAGSRPMIQVELWTFEDDVLPQLMACEDPEARQLERLLLSNTVNHTLFGDDTLVKGYLPVAPKSWFVPFGLPVKVERVHEGDTEGLGHHFIPYLHDLDEDFHLLDPSEFGVDLASSRRQVEELNELLGDLLPVKLENSALSCSPMQDLVHIMSMEDLYVAMVDCPELFDRMLDQLTDDYVRFFHLMEREGALSATTGAQHLSQGSLCFTDELPDKQSDVRVKDVWGYMDSQETAGVSPRMFLSQVLPHYKKVAQEFGLLSYGCCEAVDGLWDNGLDAIDNLRKVSISPWCNEEFMGERLRGSKTVFLRKPTPNLLGVGSVLDEDAVIKCFQKTVAAAQGCTLEIAQRDVYQLHSGPEKVRRYVELARRELEKHHK